MKRILVTAFEPFGGEAINPTQAILAALPDAISGAVLHKAVLPVVYGESAKRLFAEMDLACPDAVMMLGQAGGRSRLTPERVAINLDHAELADNAGEARTNTRIHPEGPDAYFTTLPVEAMLHAIAQEGVPCALSVSAGAFLCNHTLFEALHRIHGNGERTLAGFIHVPYLPEQTAERPGVPSMPLRDMVKGIHAAIAAVAAEIE